MERARHFFLEPWWREGAGIDADQVHMQVGEGCYSRILQGPDPAVPSRTC